MGISFRSKGGFDNTEKLLKKMLKMDIEPILEKYAQEGVSALSMATPKDSGVTASSWGYEIEKKGSTYTIYWTNSNVNQGVNIALILQYGHGTGTGGYVQGRDYINPSIQPVFDRIAEEAWREITK